jgi:DNA repair exonuclease SbcCD ATPase subunit
METTKDRLSRVTAGLMKVLNLCDAEISTCFAQKTVREEALKKNVVDQQPILEQLENCGTLLDSIMEKTSSVSSRMNLSENEIKRLQDVTKELSKASTKSDEVRSLVEHYKASIRHHEDIIGVAKSDLKADLSRKLEIETKMKRMQEELEKAKGILCYIHTFYFFCHPITIRTTTVFLKLPILFLKYYNLIFTRFSIMEI